MPLWQRQKIQAVPRPFGLTGGIGVGNVCTINSVAANPIKYCGTAY
jgi:hypothetical protein